MISFFARFLITASLLLTSAPLFAQNSDGIFIAVGNGLHRISSNDGKTWTNHVYVDKPGHNQNDLKAIASGNGVCVAVGGYFKSNILTTKDGIKWHQNDFNIGVLSGVIFTDGKFYIFGEGGRVAASEDGMTWEKVGDLKLKDHLTAEAKREVLEKPIKSNIRRWRHANGLFVGAGDNCIIVSTRDFQDWKIADRLEPRSRLFIETDGKVFVVHGDQSLHVSSDGMNWTDVSPELPHERLKFHSLVHDGKRFIVNTRGHKNSPAWESKDGRTWALVEGETFPATISTLRPDLYYSFETYWKYTENFQLSTDGGKTWQAATIPAPAGITNIIHATELPKF